MRFWRVASGLLGMSISFWGIFTVAATASLGTSPLVIAPPSFCTIQLTTELDEMEKLEAFQRLLSPSFMRQERARLLERLADPEKAIRELRARAPKRFTFKGVLSEGPGGTASVGIFRVDSDTGPWLAKIPVEEYENVGLEVRPHNPAFYPSLIVHDFLSTFAGMHMMPELGGILAREKTKKWTESVPEIKALKSSTQHARFTVFLKEVKDGWNFKKDPHEVYSGRNKIEKTPFPFEYTQEEHDIVVRKMLLYKYILDQLGIIVGDVNFLITAKKEVVLIDPDDFMVITPQGKTIGLRTDAYPEGSAYLKTLLVQGPDGYITVNNDSIFSPPRGEGKAGAGIVQDFKNLKWNFRNPPTP